MNEKMDADTVAAAKAVPDADAGTAADTAAVPVAGTATDEERFLLALPAAERELYQRLGPEEQRRWRVAADRMARERRKRPTPLSSERKLGFLAALAAGMTVQQAADMVGVSLSTLYREKSKSERFRQDWESALEVGVGEIEERLRRWTMADTPDGLPTVAQVRSAEVLLKSRSRRFNAPAGEREASARLDAPGGAGSLTVRIGTPGPD